MILALRQAGTAYPPRAVLEAGPQSPAWLSPFGRAAESVRAVPHWRESSQRRQVRNQPRPSFNFPGIGPVSPTLNNALSRGKRKEILGGRYGR